jgi:hypothetical protein
MMSATFKRPTRQELFYMLAAVCLLVAPEFIMKATVFDTMAILQLILMILFALCVVAPLWYFYKTFLKGPLRARRIERIRHDRLLREIMEERKIQGQ